MMPSIQGQELTQNDIGRQVTYETGYGEWEHGVLSSFRDDGSVFVRFKGPQGERCNPEFLLWGIFDNDGNSKERQ